MLLLLLPINAVAFTSSNAANITCSNVTSNGIIMFAYTHLITIIIIVTVLAL